MLHTGDSVRLLRGLPEMKLALHQEGTVIAICRNEDGNIPGAEGRFYTGHGAATVAVPLEAVEPLVTQFHGCTAVLWMLARSPQQVVEEAMHAMLDHGFEMRQGLT